VFGAEFARAVEALAARILDDHGKANDPHAWASARRIAEAEFEVARVQRIKVALIERAHNVVGLATLGSLPPMPEDEPQRTAEAVRRVLPELVRLNRYEVRAVARRDQAIRTLVLRKSIVRTTED
jgi:hypothetical protein